MLIWSDRWVSRVPTWSSDVTDPCADVTIWISKHQDIKIFRYQDFWISRFSIMQIFGYYILNYVRVRIDAMVYSSRVVLMSVFLPAPWFRGKPAAPWRPPVAKRQGFFWAKFRPQGGYPLVLRKIGCPPDLPSWAQSPTKTLTHVLRLRLRIASHSYAGYSEIIVFKSRMYRYRIHDFPVSVTCIYALCMRLDQ